MSYVLDALNKSQQQAQPLSAPTLRSEHLQAKPEPGYGRLISLCVTVLVINIGLVWYFFSPNDPGVTENVIVPTVSPVPSLEPANLPQPEPRQTAANEPDSIAVTQPPIPPTSLPALNITSHVYADSPIYRQVFINGRSLQQQEWLQDDLQVKEITELGVIFLYRGVEFAVDLQAHWQ